MKNNDNYIDESLLVRYLKNDLTDQEYAEVEAWMNLSEDNRKVVQDYFYLSWAVSASRTLRNTSPQDALKKVNRRLRTQRIYTLLFKLQQAAAILFLPLLLFAVYLYFSPEQRGEVAYIEAHMAPGMTGTFYLPDSTKVWLNSDTYLRYPVHFDGSTREVEIDGEAYFMVRENKEKKFIVHAGGSSVIVLGTEFNIDAYSSNNLIVTTLVEGSLAFHCIGEDTMEETVYMKPNEQVLYDKDTYIVKQNKTYIPKDIAWMKGQIILKDTPFSEILWILGKSFNTEFVVKNPSLYEHAFTATFTNHGLERILDYFKRASDISYTVTTYPDDDGEILKKCIELY